MTHEELQELITRAETVSTKGNYAEAEECSYTVLDALNIPYARPSNLENKKTQKLINLSPNEARIGADAFVILATIESFRGNYDSAIERANHGLLIAEQNNLLVSKAKVLNTIGNLYSNFAEHALALEYFQQALAINEKLDNKDGMARQLGNIGILFFSISDYPRALEYYQKSLLLFEELESKSNIARNYGNLGNVYYELFDFEKALEFYQKAVGVFEELDNKNGVASYLGNIGLIYVNFKDYSLALEYYYKSLKINEELGSKSGIAVNLGNIGYAYQFLNDYSLGLENMHRALAINEELGNKNGLIVNLGNIGTLYADKKFEGYSAIKSEEFLLRAISICEEINRKQKMYTIFKSLSELYEQEENHAKALTLYKKYHDLEKEVEIDKSKKQADQLAYERREAEREKQLATERARLEEREKIIDELTELNSSLHEANRQKNEVLGIVAHDLKNPLAAILLSSGSLTRYIEHMSKEEVHDQLGRIKSTAERMNQIILNLLDIQKLESGKHTLSLQPIDISSLLLAVVHDYQEPSKKKNITLHTAVPDFSLIANSEQTALHEVLENLISNAVKYSPFDKNIFVRAESDDQTVRISIQDEGPGLTDDDKSKLFGQFTRLSAKPTGGEHSTGLGLSIVKRMVEMMNGKIWCESELGKGATFIVELPRAE